MNPTAAKSIEDAAEARDRQLAELLDELTHALRVGLEPDLDAASRRHPELAEELRGLWAALTIAEELARSSSSSATGLWPDLDRRRVEPESGPIEGIVILDELGRGGMGIVHRVRQVPLNRVVALKRLLHGASSKPEDLARFRVEAAAAARLSHPHIVAVHEVGTRDGEPYFLMQYVEGTTLARRLLDGPLPPREAATLLVPIARAIQHAHDRDVLHRDLKPSNILIDREGRPLVGDFGLAKRVNVGTDDSLTISGAILGTPSYMAPEQAASRRGEIGPRTDVYSLGAILYQMLTGRPPFQAATTLDTLYLVLEQDPVPPRILNPKADPDLEMVALKCLQKSPELRFATAEALALDVEAYLEGKPVSARSTSFRALAVRLLRETQHSSLLENWGDLLMYHSLALIVFYGATLWLLHLGVWARWPYFLIFTVGLGGWAWIYWGLRRRRGPITFVDRQLAHVWGSGVIALNLILLAEWLYGIPVMGLAALLNITNGMLLFVKGGLLSGEFYVHGGLMFLTLIPAVLYPSIAIPAFALVSAACFFVTGFKYHRRHLRALKSARSGKG